MKTQIQAVGRSLGAIFLIKGVRGVPSVPGVDVTQPIERILRKLPPDFFYAHAEKMVTQLTSWLKDEDLVEEVLAVWLRRFVVKGKWEVMGEGLTLRQALAYIYFTFRYQAINTRKALFSEREITISDSERESVEDPTALEQFLGAQIWREPAVRRILEQQAHPDAPLYLDLLVEGYNMNEIVGDWRLGRPSMLPHVQQKPITPQGWWQRTMPKILTVLRSV